MDGGGKMFRPAFHPHLQQAFGHKSEDDVNGFSSTWDIYFLLVGGRVDGMAWIENHQRGGIYTILGLKIYV